MSATRRQDIPSLTGLRFFAAAMIVFNHTAGFYFLPAHSVFADFRHVSYLGMTLFFTLSGFVIHYNYGETLGNLGGIYRFSVARFARLYPLYLLALLAIAIFPGNTNQPFDKAWFYCLTATHAWFPIKIGDTWLANIAQGTWSISVEIFLYLLYIPFAKYLARLSLRGALVLLGITIILFDMIYGGRVMRWWLTPQHENWWFYFSPYCRIPEFLLGAITAQIVVRLPTKATLTEHRVAAVVLGCSLSAILFLLAAFWLPHIYSRTELFQASGGYAPACAGLIYYGARFRAKALTWRPFIAFGEGSYSMYLLHGWFLWLFSSQGVGEGLLMWGKVGVAWLFIAVCSLGCYRYFERPTRSWLRSALRPGVKLRMSEVTIAVQ